MADQVLRAMTDDGAFRIVCVESTQVVGGIIDMQQATGASANILADLATGTVLLRETMSPSQRVQGILKAVDTAGYILADSHPSGQARGLISGAHRQAEISLAGSRLQVMRSLQNGQIQQGVVAVPEEGTVSRALMAYLQDSEQVTSMLAVNTTQVGGQLKAGGYLVQLLPDAPPGPLAVMTERLEDFRDITHQLEQEDFSPRTLLKELLYLMPHTELGDSGIEPGCWCSRQSMLGALASLKREEIQSMVDDAKPLEIACDYCRVDYRVPPAELLGLLEVN